MPVPTPPTSALCRRRPAARRCLHAELLLAVVRTVSALSAAWRGAGRACAGRSRRGARREGGQTERTSECTASVRGGMACPQGNASHEKTAPCSLLPRKARRPSSGTDLRARVAHGGSCGALPLRGCAASASSCSGTRARPPFSRWGSAAPRPVFGCCFPPAAVAVGCCRPENADEELALGIAFGHCREKKGCRDTQPPRPRSGFCQAQQETGKTRFPCQKLAYINTSPLALLRMAFSSVSGAARLFERRNRARALRGLKRGGQALREPPSLSVPSASLPSSGLPRQRR